MINLVTSTAGRGRGIGSVANLDLFSFGGRDNLDFDSYDDSDSSDDEDSQTASSKASGPRERLSSDLDAIREQDEDDFAGDPL